MKRRLRFGCLLMCFMLLFSDMVVFATGQSQAEQHGIKTRPENGTDNVIDSNPDINPSVDSSQENNASDSTVVEDSAEVLAARDRLGLKDDAKVAVLKAGWDAMHVDGYSDEACAGAFGNWRHEGTAKGETFNPTAEEHPGQWSGGYGLAQWTATRLKNSDDSGILGWSSHCGCSDSEKFNKAGYLLCSNTAHQMSFAIQEVGVYTGKNMANYNTFASSSGVAEVPLNVISYGSQDEYKLATDVVSAATNYFMCNERPGVTSYFITGSPPSGKTVQDCVDNLKARVSSAKDAYIVFTETHVMPDSQTGATVATQLLSAGYWNEDDLSAYAKLMELDVDLILEDALRENLSQDELNGLSIWERNITHDIEENGFIVWCRRIVMLVGILFTMWVSLIYFAYWFDRVNSFFYVDLLGLLTFGHLHMSDTEKECTFHVQDIGKEGRKTVNHKTILFICIVGIAFGVCIVTGVFYDLLQFIVYKIFKLLGKY